MQALLTDDLGDPIDRLRAPNDVAERCGAVTQALARSAPISRHRQVNGGEIDDSFAMVDKF